MLWHLAAVYLLLLISGFGYAYSLTDFHENRLALTFALSPLVSAALIAIGGVFILAYSNKPSILFYDLFYILIFGSIALTLIYVFVQDGLFENFKISHITLMYVVIALVAAFALNNYENGIFYNYVNRDIGA